MVDRTFKLGDSAPNIENTLAVDSEPVDLTNADTVEFVIHDKFEKEVLRDDTNGSVSIEDATGGTVSFDISSGDLDSVGLYDAEWVVSFADGEVISFPNHDYIEIEVLE